MADVFEIPLDPTESSIKLKTKLSDEEFVLHVFWNGRMARWMLNFFTANEEPILMGLPLNMGVNLFGRFKDDRIPPGVMLFFDVTRKTAEAGRNDLGVTHKLVYLPI